VADKEFATVIAKKANHTLEFINISCLIHGEQDRTVHYTNQKELDLILDIFKDESDKENIPVRLVVIDMVGRQTTINYNFAPLHKLGDITVVGDKTASVRYFPNQLITAQRTSKEYLHERMHKWHKQYELGFITEEALLTKLKELIDE
jgi:hypothetical protein|tara:strand:+ start:272 stop:715 length:444 start_codon:yes stop_codon:yes gene_type:complete